MKKAGLTYNQLSKLLVVAIMLLAGLSLKAQWLEGYSHRIEITLNHDLVPGNNPLTGFPCLVSFTDTLLRTEPNGGVVQYENGTDLCFTDEDMLTILDYEIESYDPVSGTLHAWVRIPSLSALEETDIFLYFGGADASPQWDTTAVWSNQYTAVWHMNNDPSGPDPQLQDATSYQNHGSTAGGMAPGDLRDGMIAGAVWFDGVDDYATMPVNGFNTEAGTVELWINTDSIPTFWAHYIFAHRQQSPIRDRVYIRYRTDSLWSNGMGNTMDLVQGSKITTGTWYHMAIRWDGAEVTGYLDGAQDFGPTPYAELDTVREIFIMTWMPSSEAVTGRLDELRVSDVARDSAWIATSYNNQFQPELFHQIGASEEGSPVPNDVPCEAIELMVRESCSFDRYTNLHATNSGVPEPGCGDYQGGDVWFKLEVPPSGAIDIQTYTEAENQYPNNDGWMYRGVMAVYSGNCGNLTLLECNLDSSTYHPRMSRIDLFGLTPGDTLWVRIFENYNNDLGMFDICVVDPGASGGFQPYDVQGGGGFCQGDTGVSVFLSDSDPGVLYTLILQDTTRLDTLTGTGFSLDWPSLTNPGIYMVEARNPENDSVLMMNDSATVQVNPLPQLSALASDASCFELDNGSIALSVIAQAPYVTEWTGPSGFTSLEEDPSGLAPGDYVVTVTDSNGCVRISSPINITEPSELVVSVDSIKALTSYEARDGSVGITITGGIPPYQVLWTGTDGYESILEDADSMTVGYYRVMVTDYQLCQNTIEGIRLVLEEDPAEIFIPESFSPNGDGYNDRFVILGIEQLENNELMVFTRQGITVYYRANYQNDWDGTPEEGRVQGGELPEGTYYYIFKYGQNGIRKGFVYINR
jgi:gliding motility-associated-like protein